jgi:YD repeat-containing protein
MPLAVSRTPSPPADFDGDLAEIHSNSGSFWWFSYIPDAVSTAIHASGCHKWPYF